jgi:hypothetical protein
MAVGDITRLAKQLIMCSVLNGKQQTMNEANVPPIMKVTLLSFLTMRAMRVLAAAMIRELGALQVLHWGCSPLPGIFNRIRREAPQEAQCVRFPS